MDVMKQGASALLSKRLKTFFQRGFKVQNKNELNVSSVFNQNRHHSLICTDQIHNWITASNPWAKSRKLQICIH